MSFVLFSFSFLMIYVFITQDYDIIIKGESAVTSIADVIYFHSLFASNVPPFHSFPFFIWRLVSSTRYGIYFSETVSILILFTLIVALICQGSLVILSFCVEIHFDIYDKVVPAKKKKK